MNPVEVESRERVEIRTREHASTLAGWRVSLKAPQGAIVLAVRCLLAGDKQDEAAGDRRRSCRRWNRNFRPHIPLGTELSQEQQRK